MSVATSLLSPSVESQESQVADDEPEVAPPLIPVRPARIAALLAVPLLWGTFTPVLKVLLKDKNHPPALLTNLLSHSIGAIMLSNLWLLQSITLSSCPAAEPKSRQQSVRASAELGLYLFFGQLTQLLGLKSTSVTTNAILVQASVIVVPLLDRSGGDMRRSTWGRLMRRLIPSTLALLGVVLLTIGPDASLVASVASVVTVAEEDWKGIAFSLVSAACYALHTVRLSAYGDVEPTAQASPPPLPSATHRRILSCTLAAATRIGGRHALAYQLHLFPPLPPAQAFNALLDLLAMPFLRTYALHTHPACKPRKLRTTPFHTSCNFHSPTLTGGRASPFNALLDLRAMHFLRTYALHTHCACKPRTSPYLHSALHPFLMSCIFPAGGWTSPF
jgi:drug/metabolite transporter (DMT)-like permease